MCTASCCVARAWACSCCPCAKFTFVVGMLHTACSKTVVSMQCARSNRLSGGEPAWLDRLNHMGQRRTSAVDAPVIKTCSCKPHLSWRGRLNWSPSSAPASPVCRAQSGVQALLLQAPSVMSNLVLMLCSWEPCLPCPIWCSRSAPASSVHRARSCVQALLLQAPSIALDLVFTLCSCEPRLSRSSRGLHAREAPGHLWCAASPLTLLALGLRYGRHGVVTLQLCGQNLVASTLAVMASPVQGGCAD